MSHSIAGDLTSSVRNWCGLHHKFESHQRKIFTMLLTADLKIMRKSGKCNKAIHDPCHFSELHKIVYKRGKSDFQPLSFCIIKSFSPLKPPTISIFV